MQTIQGREAPPSEKTGMPGVTWLVAFAVIILIPLRCVGEEKDEQRLLVTAGATDVYVRAGECLGDTHLLIDSPREDFFSNPNIPERHQVFSALQIAIPDNCPHAKRVRISGLVIGRYVFEGCSEQKDGWAVRTIERLDDEQRLIDPYKIEKEADCRLSKNALRYPNAYLILRDTGAGLSGENCAVYVSMAFGVEAADASVQELCRK